MSPHATAIAVILAAYVLGMTVFLVLASRGEREREPEREDAEQRPGEMRLAA